MYKKSIFGIVWLLLSAHSMFSQTIDGQNYVVTQYGMEQGLPQSSVNDVIQTKDGYIWLATFGGLVRFDGHSFTTFNRSNTKGMYFDRVVNVFEDSRGSIWIGAEQGVAKFINNEELM